MYKPSIAPVALTDLSRWVEGELQLIDSAVSQGRDLLGFTVLYQTPAKPRIGHVYFADGVDWNPGAGEGLYEYTNLGYAKLGGGDGNVVPTSHSILQDLLNDDHPQYLTEARGDVRYYTKAQIDALIKTTFIALTDTPSDYTGNSGKIVAVNSGESGLEFVIPGSDGTFIALQDTPIDYVNQAGKAVLVTDTEDALEFVSLSDPFLGTRQIDGGFGSTVYKITQDIDGGGAQSVYTPNNIIDGGSA